MSPEAWIARSGAALCRGARWPLAFSLGLSLLAGLSLMLEPLQAPIAKLVIVCAGVTQVYLALRIEFDRVVFERFAEDPEGAPTFDAALVQAGWAKSPPQARTMADRVHGMYRFVKIALFVLLLQVGLVGWTVPGWALR